MKTNKMSLIIKIVAVVASIYGIIKTYFGPLTFSYFTTLSNIFISVTLLISIIKDICSLCFKKEIKLSNSFYITKFLATISITLTFFVYLTMLAPTIEGGFIYAYLHNGAGSLCVHFITPILAIIDFLMFDKEYKAKNIHAIYATVPPLIYVLFVVVSGSFGLRWGTMAAPYNFLNYKAPTGWFGIDFSVVNFETLGIGVCYSIIVLSIIFILIGRLFLYLRKK